MEHMNTEKKTYKRALTIAGSDPSGGAGIQADLKTFSACGCFGTSAIVAVVDENTVGVTGVHPVPVEFVVGQIRSVLDDIGADAVKIGMLHSSELIRAVRQTLGQYAIRNVVLDPVMVATSGDPLLQQEAIATLRDELVPHVRIITPNIPEAELLLGRPIASQEELPEAARELSRNGRVSVFLKAGHLHDRELVDIFYNAEEDHILELRSERLDTPNTHGTGCTLSSALAAFLAHGCSLDEAARRAKEYIASAIAAGAAYRIGHGHGPGTPLLPILGIGPRTENEDKRRRNHPVLRRLSCTLRPSGPNAGTIGRGLDVPSRIRPPGHLRSADPVHSWMSPGLRPGPDGSAAATLRDGPNRRARSLPTKNRPRTDSLSGDRLHVSGSQDPAPGSRSAAEVVVEDVLGRHASESSIFTTEAIIIGGPHMR